MRKKWMMLLVLALFVAMPARAQYYHLPNDKAPDFKGMTVDGRPYHLYDSQSEWIIVCFWSVDCDHCQEFMQSLHRNFDFGNDYELVTFALADDLEQVQKKMKRLRLDGWHFFDEEGWDSAPFLDYDVNTAPTVFLIDKDKNIVGEAYDFDEFELLINHE